MHQSTVGKLASHNATPKPYSAKYRRVFFLNPTLLDSYGVSLANSIRSLKR